MPIHTQSVRYLGSIGLVWLVVALAGCGGEVGAPPPAAPQSSPPPLVVVRETTSVPAPSPPEVADSRHPTQFQRRRLLGHYSTENGKSGFIFDRTVTPPKARLDGDGKIEPLSSRGSVQGAVEYVSGDHRVWLRVDKESGDVLLFQGPEEHEGVPVVRDADAEPLP
jgi:hypothetical protein